MTGRPSLLDANPLITRLIRRTAWPSGWATLLLAAGLALFSLLISRQAVLPFYRVVQALAAGRIKGRLIPILTLGLLLEDARIHTISGILVVLLPLTGLAFLVTPVVAAFLAAGLVTRDLKGGQLQLLRLTNLSAAARADGYVAATLYRLRLPLALMAGLIPLFSVGALNLWVTHISLWIVQTGTLVRVDFADWMIPDVNRTFLALACATLTTGVWGLSLLAATLSVSLTLWWRNPTLVAITILPIIFGYLVGLVVFMNNGLFSPLLPPRYGAALPIALAPYILAMGFLRLARRWA